MFGKLEWFEFSKTGNIPVPAHRAGWLYFGAWAAAITVPSTLLMIGQQVPETLIWIVVAGTACLYDVRKLRRQAAEKRAFDNLHFISETEEATVQTDNYQLEIKA